MTTSGALTVANEIRLGSIILFHEEEPAIPSIAEQARVVADWVGSWLQRNDALSR